MASLRDVLPSVPSLSLPDPRPAVSSAEAHLRSIPSPPLGARMTSRGVVDDLWAAKPSAEKPYPVVLIHGTIASKGYWEGLMADLRSQGFVVFAPDFGVYGTNRIQDSARDVGAYIDQVLAATGANQVDIVGHSQGGLLARYWMGALGGAGKVHHLVSLSATHHGTTLLGLLSPMFPTPTTKRAAAGLVRRFFGAAGMQQVRGSSLLQEISGLPECEPGVRYTCIVTRSDSTVVPPESGFLLPPAEISDDSWLRCLYVQDHGGGRIRHEDMPSNQQARELVIESLLTGLAATLPEDAVLEAIPVLAELRQRQQAASERREAYFEALAAKAAKDGTGDSVNDGTGGNSADSADSAGNANTVDAAAPGAARGNLDERDGRELDAAEELRDD